MAEKGLIMAEQTINIGGRSFQVVCEKGQEVYLKSAVEMLDYEAKKINQTANRLTESKMLLMAGLLLADRITGLNEKLPDFQVIHDNDDPINLENNSEDDLQLIAAEMKIAELTVDLEKSNKNQVDLKEEVILLKKKSEDTVADALILEPSVSTEEENESMLVLARLVRRVERVARRADRLTSGLKK